MPDDDLSRRLMNLEESHRDLRESYSAFRAEYQEFKSSTQSTLTSIGERMRNLGERMTDGFNDVRTSLNNVASGALQSSPQWAAQALERKSAIISVLASLATAAFAAAVTLAILRL